MRLPLMIACLYVLPVSATASSLTLDNSAATSIDTLVRLKKTHRPFSLTASAGFPALLGVEGSWWLKRYFSLDAHLGAGFGFTLAINPTVHVPVVRLANSSHDFIVTAGAGAVMWGEQLLPKHGLQGNAAVGYGYQGDTMDVRVMTGYWLTRWHADRWEGLPQVALQVGRFFGDKTL